MFSVSLNVGSMPEVGELAAVGLHVYCGASRNVVGFTLPMPTNRRFLKDWLYERLVVDEMVEPGVRARGWQVMLLGFSVTHVVDTLVPTSGDVENYEDLYQAVDEEDDEGLL